MSAMKPIRSLFGSGSDSIITTDAQRFSKFLDLCDDLLTRVMHKPMGLSEMEKYELIDLVRGFRVFIDLTAKAGKDNVFSTEIYNNVIFPRLKASGWIAEDTNPMPKEPV